MEFNPYMDGSKLQTGYKLADGWRFVSLEDGFTLDEIGVPVHGWFDNKDGRNISEVFADPESGWLLGNRRERVIKLLGEIRFPLYLFVQAE